jgi:hypothetical protein
LSRRKRNADFAVRSPRADHLPDVFMIMSPERILGQRPLDRKVEVGDHAGDENNSDSLGADACAKHFAEKS